MNQLVELTNTCREELKTVNWTELLDRLSAQDKEIGLIGASWLHASGNQQGVSAYSDSIGEQPETVVVTGKTGDWLWLLFSPVANDYQNYSINPDVQKLFPKSLEAVQHLPGIFHAHLNWVTPNFRIPPHNDDPAGNILSIVVTFNISKNNPEAVIIDIGGHQHNFKNTEYFTFRSEIEHYADNMSDDNWVLMSLQIEKEYFNK